MLMADETGEEILAATFAHDEAGFAVAVPALVRHEVRLVAIERPDGLLVERLLDAGLRMLALHPNQVAATRDRFRVFGREVRSVRRVRAVRAGPHGPSSLPGVGARFGSDQGAAGADEVAHTLRELRRSVPAEVVVVAPTHPLAGWTLVVEGHRTVGGEPCWLVRLPDGSAGTVALSATNAGQSSAGAGALLSVDGVRRLRALLEPRVATTAAHRLTS